MKNILYTTLSTISALIMLVSCSEWEPVFTGTYSEPEQTAPVTMTPNTTIAELCAKYKSHGSPVTITDYALIGGKVTTTDQPGNFYKSFYIQDETGGIEVKMGRNSLYNDYKPGQTIYIDCEGLTIGEYGYKTGNYGGNGMISLGIADDSDSYESAYLESEAIINNHIYRGQVGSLVEPEVIPESALPSKSSTMASCPYLGKLVTLKGLKYAGEIFVLLYVDSGKDTKSADNRVFLSEGTWGVTTLAMSKVKFEQYLLSGVWDTATVGSGSSNYGPITGQMDVSGRTYKDELLRNSNAYSVSQYFKMGSTEIQLRTSGFCKFADREIPADVLDGSKSINVTGILTLYQGGVQFIVNSAADFTYEDGTPLFN